MTMIEKIEKINEAREYFEVAATEAAIRKVFKKNAEEIKSALADIAEAELVLEDAKTKAVQCAMKALLECATHQKDVLKQERRDAKEFIKNDKDEWEEESPIDIGDILESIFRS